MGRAREVYLLIFIERLFVFGYVVCCCGRFYGIFVRFGLLGIYVLGKERESSVISCFYCIGFFFGKGFAGFVRRRRVVSLGEGRGRCFVGVKWFFKVGFRGFFGIV